MHLLKTLMIFAVLGFICGCSGGDHAVKVEPAKVAPTQSLKAGLNDIAQSGELGSGVETLDEEVEKLRATDAAKADELAKEMETLKSLNNPAKIKAQAKKMADSL